MTQKKEDEEASYLERLIRIEAKIDVLVTQNTARPADDRPSEPDSSVLGLFTVKQHVALQMIIAGSRNDAIARRLGITENTAKVHVRGIAKKLQVKTRGQIVARTMAAMTAIPADEYLAVSGGLPKEWHAEFAEPDPYIHIYRSKT